MLVSKLDYNTMSPRAPTIVVQPNINFACLGMKDLGPFNALKAPLYSILLIGAYCTL